MLFSKTLQDWIAPRPEPLRLYENLYKYALQHPSTPIYFDKKLSIFPELGIKTTYLQVAQSVASKGETLLSLGIKSGDKVIIFKSANFDSYLLANSVSYAGAVAVMISPHFSSEVFAQLHNRLNNSWVIFDDETRTQVEYADIPSTRKIDCLELSNEKLISSQTEISPRRWGTEDSIVYMTHTSGTTGIPKLIAHSPNSMSWRVIFQRRMISGVYKSGIAAFHISPVHSRFNIGITSLMSYGVPLLNISDPSPKNISNILKQHRPTMLETHPNDFIRWSSLIESDPDTFSSVKYLHSTFDAINKGTMLKYLKASKAKHPIFLQVYGQSECGPMVIRPHTKFTLRFSNSRNMGIAMPGLTKVRTRIDSEGNQIIEMFSKGRAITYYKEEERFQDCINDVWWNTGDSGELGILKSLKLNDRVVDLIDNIQSTLAIEDDLLDRLTFLDELVLVHGENGSPQPVASVVSGKKFDWNQWWSAIANMPHLLNPVIIQYSDFPRTATKKIERNKLEKILPTLVQGNTGEL